LDVGSCLLSLSNSVEIFSWEAKVDVEKEKIDKKNRATMDNIITTLDLLFIVHLLSAFKTFSETPFKLQALVII
jgi:hypothetical protein